MQQVARCGFMLWLDYFWRTSTSVQKNYTSGVWVYTKVCIGC